MAGASKSSSTVTRLAMRRKSADSDKYVVIEGNRRLAAVRQLRSNLAKYPDRKNDVDKVPV